jgi:N,N'-diacetyllegionaminate synthase
VSSAMALLAGASFFEKHFTYDNLASGFDHAHALNPNELSDYVSIINNAFKSTLGNPLEISDKEAISKIRARRGFYVSKDLQAGHVLTDDDIIYVRPSTQSSENNPEIFIGQSLPFDIKKFSAIGLSDKLSIIESNWKKADSYWKNEMEEKKMKRSS